MRDELYSFYADLKDKKSTARSAFKKRSHCGKGGAVRLPSDNLTKKELNALNGECKTYRLNSPMKWAEFKSMPDELQLSYLTALRNKYNVSDAQLAKMFGVAQATASVYLRKKCFNRSGKFSGREEWDKEGFYAWAYGVTKLEECQSVQEDMTTEEVEDLLEILGEDVECFETVEELEPVPFVEDKPVPVFEDCHSDMPVIPITPCSGTMSFEGKFEDVLKAVGVLIGSASGKIHIAWDVA